jgi:hypothetical protein
VQEVAHAISNTTPGTAPGPDGIPIEIWRIFDPVQLPGEPPQRLFAPVLSRVFSAMGALHQTPPRFLDGAVCALHKSGDRAVIGNYRPITLLNSDYRLLAKCLALRFGAALAPVVSSEQTAFLPGRLISDNNYCTLFLSQVMHVAGHTNAAIARLDFRKAYDTISRPFLYQAMAAVGAGGGMLQWARLLLTGTEAVAVINGFVSRRATWAAGVRQGCPLAPLLYLFVAWALTCWLRRHCEAVHHPLHPAGRPWAPLGVRLTFGLVCSSQYADDTQVLLPVLSAATVGTLLAAMDAFGLASGQCINPDKTSVVPLVLEAVEVVDD